MQNMNTQNLYIVDPVLKRACDVLDRILVAIIEFYRILIGAYCTLVLYGLAGIGVIVGISELFTEKPAVLSTLALITFCVAVFASHIFRLFFWTFLATCIPWVTLITVCLVNVLGLNPEYEYTDPLLLFIIGSAFLLPPLLASLFLTREINKRI